MKTEGLTLVEAWQALLDGKCVAFDKYTYKISDNTLMLWAGTEYWIASGEPLIQGRTFSIVPDPSIPEPKSLSFEAGVEALMDGKTLVVKESHRKHTASRLNGHTVMNVCYLDLAERRGWPIHETNS